MFSFWPAGKRQEANASAPVVATAMHRAGGPLREIGSSRWEFSLPPLKGYLIRVQGWQFPDRAEFISLTDITIDRDWFERDMALLLLEENDRLRHGSLRLIETRNGMELALGCLCPLPLYTETALIRTVSELTRETSRVIQKLLSMEFIYPRTDGEQSPSL